MLKNGQGCHLCGQFPFLPLGALVSQQRAEKGDVYKRELFGGTWT